MAVLTEDMPQEDDEVFEGKKKQNGKLSQYLCTISCLDRSTLNIAVNKSSKSEVLFNKVIEDLALTEKEYVGLVFTNEEGEKVWLDIHKDMKHQISDPEPYFEFRMKFYEPEPARIQNEYTRYLLYLQIRGDLIKGRLEASETIYGILGGYTVQAEIGDFHLSEHDHNYLDEYEFAPNQTFEMVKRIQELHKDHRGQSPAQAELNFLEIAKKLPRYGVAIYNTQDVDGPVEIGVAPLGINVYRNNRRENVFSWSSLDVILYKKRKFTIKLKCQINKQSKDNKKQQLKYEYTFDTAKHCKQCYKSCVEYHSFFRLTRPDAPMKRIDSLKLGSSFRYSDRTLYQLLKRPASDSGSCEASFTRKPSVKKPLTTRSCDKSESKVSQKSTEESLEKPTEICYFTPESENTTEVAEEPPVQHEKVAEEPPVQYEEVEVDETNPDYEKFDPEEWEIIVKTLSDGTKKRFRRRIITTTITIVTTSTYVNPTHGIEKQSVMETKPITEFYRNITGTGQEDPKFEGSESEKATVTNIEEVAILEADKSENEIETDISVTHIQNVEAEVDIDDVLSQVNKMHESFLEQDQSIDDCDKEVEETRTIIQETSVCEENMLKNVNEDEIQIQEEEDEITKKRRDEEERKLQDLYNATITSIFILDDEEEISPDKRHSDSHECGKEDEDDFEFIAVADAELLVPDQGEIVRTASLLRQKKEELREDTAKRLSTGDNSKHVRSLDQTYKRAVTLPNNCHNYSEEKGQNTYPRKISEQSYDHNHPERNASTGNDQTDFHQPHESSPHTEILYTVKDVSTVEQGADGFVKVVTAKHEDIANKENETVHRSSKTFPCEVPHVPKGHVPTHTISFNENDKAYVVKTNHPPAIAAKPTVIVPASSELPEEEVVFEVNQNLDESHPDLDTDIIESTDIPQVETSIVLFDDQPLVDNITVAPLADEPNIVATETIRIVPQTESQLLKTEVMHIIPPQAETIRTENQCIITTHTLPTEVITKTITIEGATESLSPEELRSLMESADNCEVESSVVTTTQVVRTSTVQKVVTGQTITVSGDEVDEGEMQKIVEEAIAKANNSDHLNQNVIVTTIENEGDDDDIDENGDTDI